MDWSLRIVTRLPLAQLWTSEGPVDASRSRRIGPSEITDLLRRGPVRFVVADVGHSLHWISRDHCLAFWKSDGESRTVDPRAESWHLEDFPGESGFLASEWAEPCGTPIVVLEKYH